MSPHPDVLLLADLAERLRAGSLYGELSAPTRAVLALAVSTLRADLLLLDQTQPFADHLRSYCEQRLREMAAAKH